MRLVQPGWEPPEAYAQVWPCPTPGAGGQQFRMAVWLEAEEEIGARGPGRLPLRALEGELLTSQTVSV